MRRFPVHNTWTMHNLYNILYIDGNTNRVTNLCLRPEVLEQVDRETFRILKQKGDNYPDTDNKNNKRGHDYDILFSRNKHITSTVIS